MKSIWWFVFGLCAVSAEEGTIFKKQGQTVAIDCGVNTNNKDYEWTRNNTRIFSGKKSGTVRKVHSQVDSRSKIKRNSLEISNLQESDAGSYNCQVDKKSHRYRLYIVSVSASPSANLSLASEATLQCQVKGQDPKVTVGWHRPDGNPEQSATVRLSRVTSSDFGNWTCAISRNEEVIHQETLLIRLKETVTTPSSANQSLRPDISSSGTPRHICYDCVAHQTVWLGLRRWMWGAIGAGLLALVLLIIAIIFLYRRNKRMKRKARKLRTVRKPLTTNDYCQCQRLTAAAAPPRGRQREKPSALPRQ